MKHFSADGAYDRKKLMDEVAFLDVSGGMMQLALASLPLRRACH
ncbi:hypothetical protein [Azospirillum argentinense]|uniref:Uncharacterized protein n=1 Tax=Azospirillum argentinense TaxID=2970906 RepID=A0A5B0KUJ3_9PROT|nr:hypothetical protein FH063_004535 [Azospirillum argentinense]